jgi:hypothetical protein
LPLRPGDTLTGKLRRDRQEPLANVLKMSLAVLKGKREGQPRQKV